MGLTVLFAGLMVFGLCLPVYGENAPSNRTDDFMLGYYGTVPKGDFLQDIREMYAITSYDTVKHYGKDWFWMQGILDIDENTAQSIIDLKKQTKIFYRIFWWRNPAFSDQYGPQGPDWIDLADDPQAMQTLLDLIDDAIADVHARCGDDALYGITLGEEEPYSRMYPDPDRDMNWFYANREEAERKIIFVVNSVYKLLQEKYPNVRLAIAFYPGVVEDKNKTMRYDDVVMDCYPVLGGDYSKNVQEYLDRWIKAYPPGDNVYVLLRGDYGVQRTRGPRQKTIDMCEEVFNAFYDAGYRNLGFFAEDRRSVLYDYFKELAETRSSGTYLNDKENLARTIEAETAKRARQDPVFEELSTILPAFPGAALSQARDGRRALDRAVALYEEGEDDQVNVQIAVSREHYHTAINQVLDVAEQDRNKIETSVALDELAYLLGIKLEGFAELDQQMVVDRGVLRNGSTFISLPQFYAELPEYLALVEDKHRQIADALHTKIDRANKNVAAEELAQVQPLINGLYVALDAWDIVAAIQNAGLLAESHPLVLNPYQLSLKIYNPYPFDLYTHAIVKVSQDGEQWQELTEHIERIPGGNTTAIKAGLEFSPRFMMIEPGRHWEGDWGLQEVQLISAIRKKSPRLSGDHNRVQPVRAGKSVRIAMPASESQLVTLHANTFFAHARGKKFSVVLEF